MEGLTVLEIIGIFFAVLTFFSLVAGTVIGIVYAAWNELKRASRVNVDNE